MINNRNDFMSKLTLIIVTAVITFTASAFLFWGRDQFYPDSITFDTKVVNTSEILKFNKIRNILKTEYYKNIDENALLEGAITGMVDSLGDRYTSYFTKEQWQSISEDIEGSFVGIGVTITRDTDGSLLIKNINSNSPAEKAGIKVEDKIIKIDDKDIRTISDKNTIFNMIRGAENSLIKLTVFRPEDSKVYDFNIIRERVKVDNIESKMLSNQIGYIRLMKFDSEIAKYFEEKVNSLKANGMKGLIIDVRDNPGGLYDQVVKIADDLLPKDMIVYMEDKYKHRETQESDKKELGLPLVILVNGNSASASEILAGAIKDNKKGVLVGTKTFGKGLVQKPEQLPDGSGINVTIARYFTPSGVCIHGKGIEPDIIVQPAAEYKDTPVSEIPENDDLQLNKAIETVETEIYK